MVAHGMLAPWSIDRNKAIGPRGLEASYPQGSQAPTQRTVDSRSTVLFCSQNAAVDIDDDCPARAGGSLARPTGKASLRPRRTRHLDSRLGRSGVQPITGAFVLSSPLAVRDGEYRIHVVPYGPEIPRSTVPSSMI